MPALIKSAVVLGIGAGAALGTWANNSILRIKREKAFFPGLPSHLRGLKILHITDLHGRSPTKMNINLWKKIAGLPLDMAVLTGDLIVTHPRQLRPHLQGLKALARRVPTFYVEGNHDSPFYAEITKKLEEIGLIVLSNAGGNFAVGPAKGQRSAAISVVGFRDFCYLQDTRFSRVKILLEEMAAKGGFHIILSHQPQIFDIITRFYARERAGKGFSALVLAGHTHGGQVRLPFCPTLFAPGQGILPPYGDGWYTGGKGENIKMYISRGVGATLFPVRLFNPPEVAVVEILGGF